MIVFDLMCKRNVFDKAYNVGVINVRWLENIHYEIMCQICVTDNDQHTIIEADNSLRTHVDTKARIMH